jgi:glycosyltransferase involved in cell wall biosynthesis
MFPRVGLPNATRPKRCAMNSSAWPVLLMAYELDQGGSERQLTEIAKALDRSRFEPHVGCFRPEGLRGRELKDAGIPIVHVRVRSFASPSAITGAWQLAQYIRRHKIRLVHTYDYPTTVFAVPVARFLTPAIVASSTRGHRELVPGHYLKLVRMTDHLVKTIVVNCEFLRRHLIHDENVASNRIELCYNGVDLEEFRPRYSPRPAALPPDALVIGVVCVLRPEKGLFTLLKAFAEIRGLNPNLKLAIVGSGQIRDRLEAEARMLGIWEDCIFAPATKDVADWLRAIDIFVLPSLTEALSNSLMEAMACGCCVVASNVGGNPELVHDAENGFLFEPRDTAGLSKVLRKLVEDEFLRQHLAAAGGQMIRDRFSIKSSAERMSEIYAKLIEARQ